MVGVVAGGLSLAFIGYCVYFDRKRRSDPDFKRKLVESESSFSANEQVAFINFKF